MRLLAIAIALVLAAYSVAGMFTLAGSKERLVSAHERNLRATAATE